MIRRCQAIGSIAACVALPMALLVFSSSAVHAQGGAPESDGFQYYTPRQCVEAVERSTAFYWRTTPDTLPFSTQRDTMLTASRAIASECAAQFSVNSVTPRDLIALAKVYLASGDIASAEQAIARRIESERDSSVGVRATTLSNIVVALASASPPQIDRALAMLLQLDALKGPDGARQRFIAHRALAWHFWAIGEEDSARTAMVGAITAGKDMNAKDKSEYGIHLSRVYSMLVALEGARTGTAEAPRAVIAQAREDLKSLSFAVPMLAMPDTIASLYGRKGPPIQATHWLGDSTGNRPTSGKISIIVFSLNRTNVASLRRLKDRYGDAIEITGLAQTVGFFRDNGPLTTEEELKILGEYYLDELGMPGAIAVTESQFTKLPDGRRRAPLNPTSQAYWTRAGTVVAVLDREGIIRRVFIEQWHPWFEDRIAEFIESQGVVPLESGEAISLR